MGLGCLFWWDEIDIFLLRQGDKKLNMCETIPIRNGFLIDRVHRSFFRKNTRLQCTTLPETNIAPENSGFH